MADQREGGIDWTDETWNPVRGCSRKTDACSNCYAEQQAARIVRMDRARGIEEGKGSYDGLVKLVKRGDHEEARWTGVVRLVPEKLADPVRWDRPRLIFVNSMSDVFHESVPDEWIAAIYGAMILGGHHTHQVLTKRPDRAAAFTRTSAWAPSGDRTRECINAFLRVTSAAMLAEGKSGVEIVLVNDRLLKKAAKRIGDPYAVAWPPPNVWLGTSLGSQNDIGMADEILRADAAIRFFSIEPLIGPISIAAQVADTTERRGADWVIVGGESGDRCRPMDADWPRLVIGECVRAGVAVFFKQWGGVRDVRGGSEALIDGRLWKQFPGGRRPGSV